MVIKVTECENVDWMQFSQVKIQLRVLVNTVMNLRVL